MTPVRRITTSPSNMPALLLACLSRRWLESVAQKRRCSHPEGCKACHAGANPIGRRSAIQPASERVPQYQTLPGTRSAARLRRTSCPCGPASVQPDQCGRGERRRRNTPAASAALAPSGGQRPSGDAIPITESRGWHRKIHRRCAIDVLQSALTVSRTCGGTSRPHQ